MVTTDRDFYPSSRDARAAWHANYAVQLAALAAKYNIPAAAVTAATADNTWIQFWVQQRNDEDARSQQITAYFNTISGKNETAEAPAAIDFPSPTPPAEVPPGIEARVREVASQVKGHAASAAADGEVLGIATKTKNISIESLPATVNFEMETQAEFRVKVTFRKLGNDAVRFEYRRIGGSWLPAGVLLSSPGSFAIPPAEAGVAEQVEVRGVYLKGNEEVGGFSDVKQAFIAP
jgi:hypothetical protein